MTRTLARSALLIALLVAGCGGERTGLPVDDPGAGAALPDTAQLDASLRAMVVSRGLTPVAPVAAQSAAKIKLGQALFFDKELSGNRDISCATCHHPLLHTADHLSLSFGTGGTGLGGSRLPGAGRELIPRNSPDLFTRGVASWNTLFWDGRVSGNPLSGIDTPAKAQLPSGLESVLAAQSMFPVTSADEMRGKPGDRDLRGQNNELATIDGANFTAIWSGVMARLMAIPGYQVMFQSAYPGVPAGQFSYVHAANAIAAFESDRWSRIETPWDSFCAGDTSALSPGAKQGALLFFGKAKCSECHSGSLPSDQQFHNIAVPQLGPGKGEGVALKRDYGRFLVTKRSQDRFAFRTPALRNVALTGPYMHNGAYVDLEDAVRHHLNPELALRAYNKFQLDSVYQGTVQEGEAVIQEILATLDPLAKTPVLLSEIELDYLMEFLDHLTDPRSATLAADVPRSVPSGLPVSD